MYSLDAVSDWINGKYFSVASPLPAPSLSEEELRTDLKAKCNDYAGSQARAIDSEAT